MTRNFDLASVERIVEHCDGDGRRLADFDQQTLLWAISQMVREIRRNAAKETE